MQTRKSTPSSSLKEIRVMEDGSGKCLLDVISDPSALNEFLKSTNQILLDGELNSQRAQSFQRTHLLSQMQNTQSTSNIANSSSNPATTILNYSSGTTNLTQQSTNLSVSSTVQPMHNSKPPVSFSNSGMTQTLVRNVNGSPVLSNSPRTLSTTSKSSINSPIHSLTNVTKGITMSPGTYQGKKPIPIQPKNPVILPNTSTPAGINNRGNVRPGLVTQTSTSVMSNQLQMTQPGVLPRGHTPTSVNGVDNTKSRVMPVQTNRTAPQTFLITSPKRIAPKQLLSPSSNPSLTMSSPVRLQQANTQNKQNIPLPTQLLQAPTVQVTSANPNHLYPQQMTTVVRPVASTIPATTIVQSSPAKPVQHVQQIQKLINEKLSPQQTQPSSTTQVQQKVFTQAQLQTALKQSQLIAQNSPGQQQNVLVQQQILKQLIQQAQLAQQKKQLEKTSHINVQPITTNSQGIVQQPQQIKQTVLSGPTGAKQHVTIANAIPGSNQQIQMVLPNQQVITLTQNISSITQANLNQNLKNKTPIQLGASQANITVTQPMIIVSQAGGNFVIQQGVQPSSTGITATSGTPVSIPLQTLLNQKQIQSQLTTTSVQQQQLKVAGNILQVGQAKQITQPSGTVLVQTQVPGQTVTAVKQAVSQPSLIIQSKPGLPTTQTGTTIHQLTPAQLQQLQSMGGVQKVLIIKQPDIQQKLGVQGAKPPQAIQITVQQLQALQQMQNQQQTTPQKIIIQTKGDTSGTTTTVLTVQQLKQLQQSLQQQGGKIVQIPQTIVQRQALVQQLQQQNTKTPKMAHVPRILQTSGRQVSNQVATKTTTTLKQESNRGIKRPHPETPEPPKVVRRLKNALYQDQQGVSHPDIHTPFQSKVDAFNKLRCYHVYHDPGQTPSDIGKAGIIFNTVSTQLIKRSEKMMEKYRSLILDESMRKEPSSEMVMLYRLYLADERAAVAKEKKQITEELKALRDVPKAPPPVTSVSNTPTNIVEKTAELPQPVVTKPKAPFPALADIETTEKELNILNTDSILSTPGNDLLHCDDGEGSDIELEENEIDKAVFNMESSSSSSYYHPGNQMSDSLMSDKLTDSPRTSTAHTDADESAEEVLVDDEVEKEDVTATLALLHSMAEELDGSIS